MYNTAMPRNLEADVALLHIAAGGLRNTPPPGALAQVPPRRPARGRGDDLYFVVLVTGPGQPVTSSLLDQLARQAASVFYATPGPITTAMREAASEVNEHLVSLARSSGDEIDGCLMQGVLRGSDLYLAQSGPGQVLVVRRGQVTRLSTAEADRKPLGHSVSPFLGYQHTEAHPDDFVILTAGAAPRMDRRPAGRPFRADASTSPGASGSRERSGSEGSLPARCLPGAANAGALGGAGPIHPASRGRRSRSPICACIWSRCSDPYLPRLGPAASGVASP